MIKRKDTALNIFCNLLLQAITIICGLITPRLLILSFGSEVNGSVASITQFLSYITLLESGVGGVAKAALYKPLAENDTGVLSKTVYTIDVFFKKIAWIYLGYVFTLSVVYPFIVHTSFDFSFLASLVLIIGLSNFSRYYFGLPGQILLQSDNKTYIVSNIESGALILNTILTVVLVKCYASIQIVKLGSSIVFFIRPIVIRLFVNKSYTIQRPKKYEIGKLKNRWDGFGQHVAFFIHSNTDIVVLSLFAGVTCASIYSVYLMVLSGIERIINSVITSFNATFGNLFAQNKTKELDEKFKFVESLNFILCVPLFTITAVMIIPFVQIYVKNADVSYIYPLFAYIFICAELVYCFRIPYSSLILSAGFYKETRTGAYIEAIINIVVSILLVRKYNLVGIAIGTLVAMTYRTLDYMFFLKKNIIYNNIKDTIKRLLPNLLGSIIGATIYLLIKNSTANFFEWFIQALIVTCFVYGCTFIMNVLFNKEFIKAIVGLVIIGKHGDK